MPNPRLAFLETNYLWPDFHAKFLNYWQESIAESLPAHYEARIGEQVTLVRSDGSTRRVGPDVSIVRSNLGEYELSAESLSATTVVLDHLEIEEELHETRIEILLRKDRRLVYCFVSRVEQRRRCSVTAWQGTTSLPTVPIPLLAPDNDIESPLQSVFETAFTRGRYQT